MIEIKPPEYRTDVPESTAENRDRIRADIEARRGDDINAGMDALDRWREFPGEVEAKNALPILKALTARASFEAGTPATVRIGPLTKAEAVEPPPVLWRDRDGLYADPVLSVGEVALLSAPGGSGKSYLTLQWSLAAGGGGDYGAAAGLRVRPGPVVLASYEDSPARLALRMQASGATATDEGALAPHVHVWHDPVPLFAGENRHGDARPAPCWDSFWEAVRALAPALVVVDPASAALEGASMNDGAVVRRLMRALSREAEAAQCGVLVVAHDTKQGRNEARAGGDPGAGAVAGSATWFDAARGAMYLRRTEDGARVLQCIKANYGASGWKVSLRERHERGRFAGFEATAPEESDGAAKYRRATEGVRPWDRD